MHFVASDYDGTLNIQGEVSKKDIDSINQFRAAGNLFGICTGRPIDSVYSEIEKYNIPYDFIIGINGSIALNDKNEQVYIHTFNEEQKRTIQTVLHSFDIKLYNMSNGYLSFLYIADETSHDDLELFLINDISGYYIQAKDSADAFHLAETINNSVIKNDVIAYANNDFVAIGVKGTHKANGIRAYLEAIPFEGSIHTIGDDYNDIPMLKAFNSFGIKSGIPEATKFAKHHVDSVSEALTIISTKK